MLTTYYSNDWYSFRYINISILIYMQQHGLVHMILFPHLYHINLYTKVCYYLTNNWRLHLIQSARHGKLKISNGRSTYHIARLGGRNRFRVMLY